LYIDRKERDVAMIKNIVNEKIFLKNRYYHAPYLKANGYQREINAWLESIDPDLTQAIEEIGLPYPGETPKTV
jgi:hypothetical protein